jgi:hypothetical protein
MAFGRGIGRRGSLVEDVRDSGLGGPGRRRISCRQRRDSTVQSFICQCGGGGGGRLESVLLILELSRERGQSTTPSSERHGENSFPGGHCEGEDEGSRPARSRIFLPLAVVLQQLTVGQLSIGKLRTSQFSRIQQRVTPRPIPLPKSCGRAFSARHSTRHRPEPHEAQATVSQLQRKSSEPFILRRRIRISYFPQLSLVACLTAAICLTTIALLSLNYLHIHRQRTHHGRHRAAHCKALPLRPDRA